MLRTLINRILMISLLLGFCAAYARPDPPAPAAATTAAAPAPVPYLLAGDDVLNITVVNFPELTKQVAITPDGKLSVPLLQPFAVTGMTVDEVARILTEKWNRYVVDPSVNVAVAEKRKENVLVYGFVQRPGIAEYKPPMRLLEALAQVGGSLSQADLRRVTLTHKSGVKQVLDLSHPEVKEGTETDVPLEAGDVVYVPERRIQVEVVGEVKSPGTLDYKDDMNVMDAVAAAGGVTEMADLAAATLLHDGKEQKLDLDAMYRHGDTTANVKLTPGDRLLIPEIKDRTYVFGAVYRPGFYRFKPGDRMLDALHAAQGPTPDADLGQINLIHVENKTTAQLQKVDLLKFLQKGDMKYNVALQIGDVVYIPNKKHRLGINDLWNLLAGFNIVEGVGRIFNGTFAH